MSRWLPAVAWTAILVLVTGVLWRYDTPIGIDDGLRHFVMGERLRRTGFADIGWHTFLASGFLAEHHVDPWFLADALFALLSPLGLLGAIRWFTVLGVGALAGVMWWVFRSLQVSPRLLAVLLVLVLTGQPEFYYRLLLARPYVFQTSLAMLALGGILGRRSWVVGASLFLAVPFSQLFVFPLAFAVLGTAWLWAEGDRKNARRCLLASGAGGLLGLMLLQPAPLAYAEYLFVVFLRIPFLRDVTLGGEMQRGAMLSAPWLLPVLGYIAFTQARAWRQGWSWLEVRRSGLPFLDALVLLLYAAHVEWSRAIDLLWPVAIVTLAVSLRLSGRAESNRPSMGAVVGALLLCLVGATNVFGMTTVLDELVPRQRIASYFLPPDVVPLGATVLNVHWETFTPVLAVRPDLRFVQGIDASFAYLDAPERYRPVAHPAVRGTQGTGLDPASWFEALTAAFPEADVLMFEREKAGAFLGSLEQHTGPMDLSPGHRLATYDVGRVRRRE